MEFVLKCLKDHTVTEFNDLFLQRNSGRRRNENIILPRPETNFIRNSVRFIEEQSHGAMSHTAHVRDEALHLENVRQLFQVLRVIQYQEFIVIYRSHPLTVRIVKR